MKRILPLLVVGPLVGLCVYVPLHAVAPRSARQGDDAWTACFRARGLNASLQNVSTEPARDFIFSRQRPDFRDPAFAGTATRTLEIEGLPFHVVEFPSPETAGRIFPGGPDGRNYYRTLVSVTARRWHLTGRFALVGPPERKVMGYRMDVPNDVVDRAFAAFGERAEGLR